MERREKEIAQKLPAIVSSQERQFLPSSWPWISGWIVKFDLKKGLCLPESQWFLLWAQLFPTGCTEHHDLEVTMFWGSWSTWPQKSLIFSGSGVHEAYKQIHESDIKTRPTVITLRNSPVTWISSSTQPRSTFFSAIRQVGQVMKSARGVRHLNTEGSLSDGIRPWQPWCIPWCGWGLPALNTKGSGLVKAFWAILGVLSGRDVSPKLSWAWILVLPGIRDILGKSASWDSVSLSVKWA